MARFRTMIQSEEFRELSLRWAAERARAIERCAREIDEVELRRAQGAAAALATVVELPARMLDELRIKNGE